MLEARAEQVERVPIVFTVGERQFPIKASSLGVEADWQAALRTAASEGEGFGPVRGFKRLQTRFFGAEISPPVQAYTTALDYKLGQIADEIDRNHVEAKLVRRGLAFAVVSRPGRSEARSRCGRGRRRPRAREVRARRPGAAARGRRSRRGHRGRARARRAAGEARRLRARPADLGRDALEAASLADRDAAPVCPRTASTTLEIGGPDAAKWFRRLKRGVDRAPVDATFRDRVRAWSRSSRTRTGSRSTRRRRPPRCSRRRRARRTARPSSSLRTAEPERTTADAEAMGIERRLGTYTTLNAGTFDRITNLRRAVELLHGALVAPGGDVLVQRPRRRAHDRARLPPGAGDHQGRVRGSRRRRRLAGRDDGLQRGVGVGREDPRAQPALALHQPLPARTRRDRQLPGPGPRGSATTRPNWIFVAASWDGGGITVSLYGGGTERRVESSPGTFRITGGVPLRRIPDPTLEKGTTVVDAEGSQPSATSVDRTVYNADGSVLYDETWNTSYRGEYREVRVGTKPKPKPKPKPGGEGEAAARRGDAPGHDDGTGARPGRPLRLSPSDRVDERLRQPQRPPRGGVDGRVGRRGLGHELGSPSAVARSSAYS